MNKKFSCDLCNYYTNKLFNYNRHMESKKHIRRKQIKVDISSEYKNSCENQESTCMKQEDTYSKQEKKYRTSKCDACKDQKGSFPPKIPEEPAYEETNSSSKYICN